MPILSIVTIHKNDFTGLSQTCTSLKKLILNEEIEWVVVDGHSEPETDENQQILSMVENLSQVFVSETDSGIYDAMNKGAGLANSKYVLFLNAGDELHNDFSISEFSKIANSESAEMIWGKCQEKSESGATIDIKTRSSRWAWYGMPVYHPATFYHQSLLEGRPYDQSFSIAADYDLLCRLLSEGASVKYLNSVVSIFHRGGISEVQSELARAEEYKIRLKYYQFPGFVNGSIKNFRAFNSQLSKVSWLRKLWRKWI